MAPEPLWDDVRPEAARNLLVAALESFATVGYRAATTRDIAARAGMSPAAVYLHFKSKEELLETVIRKGHESALRAFEAGLGQGADPESRIRGVVREFTAWHGENQMLARVVQHELESLPGDAERSIRALRAHFESLLEGQIEAGVAAGRFDVEDIRGVATGIFSLCIDVSRWYSERSRRTPREIGDLYAELSVRMLRAG